MSASASRSATVEPPLVFVPETQDESRGTDALFIVGLVLAEFAWTAALAYGLVALLG